MVILTHLHKPRAGGSGPAAPVLARLVLARVHNRLRRVSNFAIAYEK